MNTPFRALVVHTFGIVLVLAGFVPVVAFAIGTLVPAAEASAMLGYFPDMSWLSSAERWLQARRIGWAPSPGLIFALPGLILMYLGAAIARRQEPVFDAEQARRRDAQRRLRQYSPSERIEPTLGPQD
jgi:hypothetical protein